MTQPHVTDPVPGGGVLPRITRSMAYLQYVRHQDVPAFIQRGWIVRHAMADNHHGEYAVIMIYDGDQPPSDPERPARDSP